MKTNKTKSNAKTPNRFTVPMDKTMKRLTGIEGWDVGMPIDFIEREPNLGDMIMVLIGDDIRTGVAAGVDLEGNRKVTDYRQTWLIPAAQWRCLGVWDI